MKFGKHPDYTTNMHCQSFCLFSEVNRMDLLSEENRNVSYCPSIKGSLHTQFNVGYFRTEYTQKFNPE